SSRRYPTSGYHEYRVNDIEYVPSISVTDLGNFSSFPIIAHETAHLFGVKHDSSPVQKNGLCTAKIMKTTIGYCKFCLSWSEVSRNFMHIFFRSPDRCPFINEPRSLRNFGPSQIWTVNQQCQCYGHEPVHKVHAENITNTWIDPDLFCRTHLQCETSNGTSVKAPIPMDGTPCNKNKIDGDYRFAGIRNINKNEGTDIYKAMITATDLFPILCKEHASLNNDGEVVAWGDFMRRSYKAKYEGHRLIVVDMNIDEIKNSIDNKLLEQVVMFSYSVEAMGYFWERGLTKRFVIFPGKTQTPDEVKIHVIDNDEDDFVVNLKKVDSFLANENLPVWTVSEDADSKLILDEMYGTIDVRYVIQGVPVTNLNNPYYVNNAKSKVFKRIHDTCFHRSERSVTEEHVKTIGERWSNVSGTLIRSLRDLPEVVYVKVLILVNYDLTRMLRGKIDVTNTLVVFELLNMLNSVDMLFSKVVEPKIKINIAGIIIGTTPESFPNLNKCYKKYNNIMHINPLCSNHNIQKYLRSLRHEISPDSFDVTVFLTRYSPLHSQFFSNYLLGGATSDNTLYPYKLRKSGTDSVPSITAIHLESSGSFHIIAHELAHALRYNKHDKGPYVDENGSCNAYLMKTHAECCKDCLSWSFSTQKHFKKFFDSRDRCFFINKPLSLEKPEPRITWSAEEQCKCYGFYRTFDQDTSPVKKNLGGPNSEMCNTNLYCRDKDDKIHQAPFPMDGTPCDAGKVCWKRKCEELPLDNEYNEIFVK
ncbi:hypothetical protein PV326_002657, partial [Microctonus aethiopoides]